MTNSIYTQLDRALGQAARQGQRSILYRGRILPCVVLLGASSTKLEWGGEQSMSVAHVLVQRSVLTPVLGQEGDPRTNEIVIYPATTTAGVPPKEYRIDEVVPQEFDFALALTDVTK